MNFPKGILVHVQAKGWFGDIMMADKLANVWGLQPAVLLWDKSLFVLDAFRCHKSDNIKQLEDQPQHNTSNYMPWYDLHAAAPSCLH